MSRIGWVDCRSGVSGDMLLGALVELGVLDDLADLATTLTGTSTRVDITPVRRAGLAATRVSVTASGDQPARTLPDVLAIIDAADVAEPARVRATAAFRRLAEVEGRAHGVAPEQVHFHEVGAVDAIVDIVAGCVGLHRLGVDRLVASPLALGGGIAAGAHGALPVPVPAVVALLAGSGLEAVGGPVDVELATPTGVALLVAHDAVTGALPPMTVEATGAGAGGRDLAAQPNLLRLIVGTASASAGRPEGAAESATWQLLEANVDDLDPRLWPVALDAALAAGAADAWLTPIVMKKGRPAHTFSALVVADKVEAVAAAVFRHTTTIGVRHTTVAKRGLDREWATVDVGGQPVRVKLARLDGAVVNAIPEWDDVAAAAAALDRPAKDVLAAATAAAQHTIRPS